MASNDAKPSTRFDDLMQLVRLARGSRLIAVDQVVKNADSLRIRFHGRLLISVPEEASESSSIESSLSDAHSPSLFRVGEVACELKFSSEFDGKLPLVRWDEAPFHPNLPIHGPTTLEMIGLDESVATDSTQIVERLWDVVRYAHVDESWVANSTAMQWFLDQPDGTFPLESSPLRERCFPRPANLISYRRIGSAIEIDSAEQLDGPIERSTPFYIDGEPEPSETTTEEIVVEIIPVEDALVEVDTVAKMPEIDCDYSEDEKLSEISSSPFDSQTLQEHRVEFEEQVRMPPESLDSTDSPPEHQVVSEDEGADEIMFEDGALNEESEPEKHRERADGGIYFLE